MPAGLRSSGLLKLHELICQISEVSSAYNKSRLQGNLGEYGIYFKNAEGKEVLWFGMWGKFWGKEGFPLCFGIQDKWVQTAPKLREAFTADYSGEKKRFDNWTLGWISQDALESPDPVGQVWGQLAPVLE